MQQPPLTPRTSAPPTPAPAPSPPALPVACPPQYAGTTWNVSVMPAAPRIIKRFNSATSSPLFTTGVARSDAAARRFVAGTVRVRARRRCGADFGPAL
jgi:hypothetical protein